MGVRGGDGRLGNVVGIGGGASATNSGNRRASVSGNVGWM